MPHDLFTSRQVAELLDVTQAQVRLYARAALADPHRDDRGCYRFTFQDLIVLRAAVALASAQVSHNRIRRALERIKHTVPAGQPMTAVALDLEGEALLARAGNDVWNPESGQMFFPFAETRDDAVNVQPYDASEREVAARQAYERGCELEDSAPAEAKLMYRQAIAKNPQHVHARINLGRLLHKEGRFEAAIDQYQAGLRHDPDNVTAIYNIGVAYQDSERPGDAVAAYERALELDESFADAHYNLAYIYESEGNIVGALRHLKAYRKIRTGRR